MQTHQRISAAASVAGRFDDLIARIDRWLLSDAVVCQRTGAVYAVLDGGPRYAYPEIAGYYLSYLANVAEEADVAEPAWLRSRARSITSWLSTLCRQGMPPTRDHSNPFFSDWRNQFVFLFDLAMVLRGLADARWAGLASWEGAPLAKFIARKMMDGHGVLRPAVARAPNAKSPGGAWSVRLEGHQLKSASALSSYGQSFPRFGLADAASRLERRLAVTQEYGRWPGLPLHPRFYAMEGMLLLDASSRSLAWQTLHDALQEGNADFARIDVVAQALRLGCFLMPNHAALKPLAERLVNAVDARGAVGFQTQSPNPARNVWCTMFTRQALHFQRMTLRGHAVDFSRCI